MACRASQQVLHVGQQVVRRNHPFGVLNVCGCRPMRTYRSPCMRNKPSTAHGTSVRNAGIGRCTHQRPHLESGLRLCKAPSSVHSLGSPQALLQFGPSSAWQSGPEQGSSHCRASADSPNPHARAPRSSQRVPAQRGPSKPLWKQPRSNALARTLFRPDPKRFLSHTHSLPDTRACTQD